MYFHTRINKSDLLRQSLVNATLVHMHFIGFSPKATHAENSCRGKSLSSSLTVQPKRKLGLKSTVSYIRTRSGASFKSSLSAYSAIVAVAFLQYLQHNYREAAFWEPALVYCFIYFCLRIIVGKKSIWTENMVIFHSTISECTAVLLPNLNLLTRKWIIILLLKIKIHFKDTYIPYYCFSTQGFYSNQAHITCTSDT